MRPPEALSALALVQGSSAAPVAPQVAGRLSALPGITAEHLQAVGGRLSAAQCAGLAVLPEVWPLATAAAPETEPGVRRLLLAAALSVTDRADILLAATATDTSVVISETVQRTVRFSAGRFRFLSEADRSGILAGADTAECETIHRALWLAHRQHGLADIGLWHAVHGRAETDPRALRALLAVGQRLLTRGNPEAAFRIASARALGAASTMRSGAAMLGARSALVLGCFDDAVRLFQTAELGEGELRAQAQSGRRVAQSFLDGPDEGADALARVASQLPLLRSAAATATDHAALSGIDSIAEIWWTSPEDADERHARLYLSVIPAVQVWPWNSAPGPLSPLIEAHVRGQQAGFLLHAGRAAEATTVLGDALVRLPMTHIGGGVTSSALAALRDEAPELVQGFGPALIALRPGRTVGYAVVPDVDGAHTVAVSRTPTDEHAPRSGLPALALLTGRESGVIDLLARGLRNREIGLELGISERTVEVHLTNAFRKLGVRNRAEVLARLLEGRADGTAPASRPRERA